MRGQREPIVAVNGVTVDVQPGTTTAVVGESGSGETTIARTVLGVETPTSGEVRISDEAVWALDVLIQDQILSLLGDLQRDLGLPYLFITHDFAVVRLVAHDVLVMQGGRLVERGSVDDVFERTESDYTRELLAAILVLRPWPDYGGSAS